MAADRLVPDLLLRNLETQVSLPLNAPSREYDHLAGRQLLHALEDGVRGWNVGVLQEEIQSFVVDLPVEIGKGHQRPEVSGKGESGVPAHPIDLMGKPEPVVQEEKLLVLLVPEGSREETVHFLCQILSVSLVEPNHQVYVTVLPGIGLPGQALLQHVTVVDLAMEHGVDGPLIVDAYSGPLIAGVVTVAVDSESERSSTCKAGPSFRPRCRERSPSGAPLLLERAYACQD